jgi:hypothetical protein
VYLVCSLDVGPFVQQERHSVRLPLLTGLNQGRITILQKVEVVRKTLTETSAVLRCTHGVFGIDVGPFVQQERHSVRLTIPTGPHQGRLTVL